MVSQEREATRTSTPFVVMAKPVGSICNLDCGYCYYLDTARMYDRPHRFKMTDDLLETYVRQYLEGSPGPIVHFVWHGGEPALAGLSFYQRAVELQRRYLPDGWTCWNNLQTNGTLLDDEWCAFLAAERFQVGLSIDGLPSLHDAQRPDRSGAGSYTRVAAAARRLLAHGVEPDLLCTVTAETARSPVAVYRALREIGSRWIQFIPIVRRGPDGQVTPDSVSPEAYGDFLCAVFDEWAHHDIGRLDVQFFAELKLIWSGRAPTLCVMARTCGRVLVLEHDGAVYACDHFVDAEHRIGNVATSALATLVDSEGQQQFGADKREGLPAQCRACPWLSACNGGCPKDRVAVTDDGEAGLNYLCAGLQRFFAYAERPLRTVIGLERRGVRVETIMAGLREDSLAVWRGVGRNDPCPCGSGRKAKQCCWDRRP